ncbi:hypothetical protein Ga0100230_004625 [Opitutaceae bacterium TAV3]|nr:hypothetical protein Ga0100230_004625 [Opitutaceae bacterium TAV3]
MKNDGQLNIRLPEEVLNSLLKIEESHGMTANEVLRRLAFSAAQFYQKHGWFSFPATVTPAIFQNQGGETPIEAETPVSKSRVPSAKGRVNPQKHSANRSQKKFSRDVSRGKDRFANVKEGLGTLK